MTSHIDKAMTSTLHITVESTADFFESALSDLQDVDSDKPVDDRYVLSLPDENALERVLSAKNLELLRAIATGEPDSVRDLARRVDRDIKNVSTALNELEALGLVEFETAGRAKRPVVWYDDIEVDIQLADTDHDETGPAPA
jgi:predicted transcriptional regulator